MGSGHLCQFQAWFLKCPVKFLHSQPPKLLLRHLPLQFTPEEAKLPWGSGGPRNQRWSGESAATLWTLSVTTVSPLVLTGTSSVAGLFMTVVLRTCPGAGTAEINSKHNRLSGSQLPQVNFPHSVHGKNKDPNLHHRTRCSASLITAGMPIKTKTRNQVPSVPSEYPQESLRKGNAPHSR